MSDNYNNPINRLSDKELLSLLETEIQIQYAKLSEMKTSPFDTVLLFLGVTISIAITSLAQEIGLSWFLLGLIILILLSIHYFVIFRKQFILGNDKILKLIDKSKNFLINRLLFKTFKGIKFPILIGFCISMVAGLISIFTLPTAYTQFKNFFEGLQQEYGIVIAVILLLIVVGFFIYDAISYYRAEKKRKGSKEPILSFNTTLTNQSDRIKYTSINYILVSVIIFPSLYMVFPDLSPKNFGLEVLMLIIFLFIGVFSIQLVNNQISYEIEFAILKFLKSIKNQLLFSKRPIYEIAELFTSSKIIKIHQSDFFQFFSFYYYSLDRELIEKTDKRFLKEFIDFVE